MEAMIDLTKNEELLKLKEKVEQKQDEEEDDNYGDDEEHSNDHDKEEDKDKDKGNENDREEKEKEDEIPKFDDVDCYKIFPEFESEKEPITDYKQQCLILEEDNKDLNAKLAAAAESLLHYLQIEKDYLEDRNKWEQEKKDNLRDRNKWETEKNNLSAKLHSANSSAESYKAESEKLREERDNLSTKLFAHTNPNLNAVEVMQMENRNLAYQYLKLEDQYLKLEEKNRKLNKAEHNKEYYHNLVRVMEEKNRKVNEEMHEKLKQVMEEKNRKVNEEMHEKLKQLEKNKRVLAAKLAAANLKSKFYLSYLQDRGF